MSERPKRSRKVVNYGEDHLHWVEEAQLQKALLRSLADSSPTKKSSDEQLPKKQKADESKELCLVQSEEKMKRKNVGASCSAKLFPKNKDESFENSGDVIQPKSESTNHGWEDSFELRLTRLQSKLLEEAGMFSPTTDTVVAEGDCSTKDQVSANLDLKLYVNKIEDSDAEESLSSLRVRAQRKFASNSSPPSSRGNSPVKMHKQKNYNESSGKKTTKQKEKQSTRERAVRASSTSTLSDVVETASQNKKRKRKRRFNFNRDFNKNYTSSLFKEVPRTDAFLDFLCFRNTTVKVELHDCMKN